MCVCECFVLCVGENSNGVLGQGLGTGIFNPATDVPLPEPVTQLSVGGRHVCVLMVSGNVSCWGPNSMGQLGVDPDVFPVMSTPTPPLPLALPGIEVSTNVVHTCVVLNDNSLRCFGSNACVDGLSFPLLTRVIVS